MIRFSLLFSLCLGLTACSTTSATDQISNFNNRNLYGEDGQTIAFIGQKIALQEVPYEEWCGVDEICLDQRFNARYKVIEVLEGDYRSSVIDFEVYDHGARNPFWKHEPIILYVGQYKDRLVHQKYQYDLLSPLKGGGFAFCGDPYSDYDVSEIEENGREDLSAFKFSPTITHKVSDYLSYKDEDIAMFEQEDIREDFIETMRKFAPPAFEIKGNIATCKMGMIPKDVAAIRMEYQFIPEREYSELRTKCWEQAGLPSDGATIKMMEDSGFNQCMKMDK